ncbi:hypothetical protein [Castellaniella sp.]|nr:hypothetical protein [Castellaniella sp.]
MDSFIDFIDMYSWAMLLSIFVILGASAFLGKHLWVRHKKRDTVLSEELGIILGATLSLFGLLMGFILSIAIDGYNNRISAEEYEAIAIGNAFQRTTLLANASQQTQAQKLLHDYLDLRIQFFDTAD